MFDAGLPLPWTTRVMAIITLLFICYPCNNKCCPNQSLCRHTRPWITGCKWRRCQRSLAPELQSKCGCWQSTVKAVMAMASFLWNCFLGKWSANVFLLPSAPSITWKAVNEIGLKERDSQYRKWKSTVRSQRNTKYLSIHVSILTIHRQNN